MGAFRLEARHQAGLCIRHTVAGEMWGSTERGRKGHASLGL